MPLDGDSLRRFATSPGHKPAPAIRNDLARRLLSPNEREAERWPV
jgi:hypothetical protein